MKLNCCMQPALAAALVKGMSGRGTCCTRVIWVFKIKSSSKNKKSATPTAITTKVEITLNGL